MHLKNFYLYVYLCMYNLIIAVVAICMLYIATTFTTVFYTCSIEVG